MKAAGAARGAAAATAAAVLLSAAPPLPAGAERSPPPRPEPCREVSPEDDLQAALDAAAPGGALCLRPGRHRGPARVGPGRVVWGPADAVITSAGAGSTVSVEGDGGALLGIGVDGSGGRHDLLDAAVRVRGDGVRVEGVGVRNALFGLLVERSNRVVLRGNTIRGDPEQTLGMRGDGIRIWEVRRSRIEHNRVFDSRDIVIWYSPGNRIAHNRVVGGRYGTHLMYSHDNEIVGNRYDSNVVGLFAMYSRHLRVSHNTFMRSGGAAGVGLGAKESGALAVEDNGFVANTVALYLDTSPLEPADHNRFARNQFRFSGAAVVFHGGADRNHFRSNHFADNRSTLRVEGRGDALRATWRENYYDDYKGYDLDRDGRGDLPYELRSLSSSLETRRPELAFFRGSVALALVELVGEALPLFRPTALLVDPTPRLSPPPHSRPPRGAGPS